MELKNYSVQDILLLRESEEVEFKKAAGRDGRGEVPDNFWETYSAMANTKGGYIFLGVAEKNGRFHFAGLPSTEPLRIDDTPVHVAVREALVNTLIHADYSDRASVLVIKRPDMFLFRNPGLMRVSWESAMHGGDSDCRNHLLQDMFRYVGMGERAGSGIPKILNGWKTAQWRVPNLYEKIEPYNQTFMELWMIDLLEPSSTHLPESSTHLEPSSTHLPENTTHLDTSSTHLPENTTHLDTSSTHLPKSSTYLDTSSTHLDETFTKKIERDSDGCIISERLSFPIVDKIDSLSRGLRSKLESLAEGAREQKKIPQHEMEQILLSCCSQRYMTLAALAQVLNRSDKTLRNSYLSRMVKEKKLSLAFPDTPNDPRQAYIAAESLNQPLTTTTYPKKTIYGS